jgi:Domain of unknown function (DUF4268)
MTIGRLTRLPLRDVWAHEAHDFTTWLQSNIEVLDAAIGIELTNVEREQAAGSFSVDLVAEDRFGAKIIIENQLGKSDHDHLGKVLTYLAAMSARAAIWIVADPRPEHVAAISWLNDSSSADFYLLKIEAVKIGDSPPALLLTRIVAPSIETKAVSATNREFSQRYDLREQWWVNLLRRPGATAHKHLTPGRYSWIGLSSGVRGLNLNYAVRQHDSQAELYIDRGNGCDDENRRIFDELHSHKDEIEQKFGGPLKWEALEGKRACRVSVTVEGGYKSDPEEWDEIQDELVGLMIRLTDAFRPLLNQQKLSI